LLIRNRSTENHLFRLAQEAINNSVKHGKAKRVVVSLKPASGPPEGAVLMISDDGVGFDAEAAKTTGLGLRIMNYRAQKIGATLEVQSAQPTGVIVTCTFPTP
jgi:signal transduction histidine kinase